MIIQGVISKFGSFFILIPDPVVGGIFCVMFGMITAFGLSALQYVDLRSSRNLYIIGVSIFFPLVLCQWVKSHPGSINTGSTELDGTLSVLLGTTILVGGCLGCFLDNLIPGTRAERGIDEWENEMSLKCNGDSNEKSTYDFPCGMTLLRRYF